jgi:hypothetical protein
MVEKAVEGMKKLSAIGYRYPIPVYGAECDAYPTMAAAYPKRFKLLEEKARQAEVKK